MTSIHPETEFPGLKKPITHTHTHNHRSNICQKTAEYETSQYQYQTTHIHMQEPRDNKHNNTHYTKRDNTTQ